MGKKFRTSGALLILLIIFIIIFEIIYYEVSAWLFTTSITILLISVCVLLFAFGNYADENERRFKLLDQRIKQLEGEERIEISTPDDAMRASVHNKSIDVLEIRKGILYFGEYMTLLSNITETHLEKDYLVITIFKCSFYFSFIESNKNDAIKIRDSINKSIGNKK